MGKKEFKIHKFTLFSLVLTTHLKIGIQSFFFLMSKTQFKNCFSFYLFKLRHQPWTSQVEGSFQLTQLSTATTASLHLPKFAARHLNVGVAGADAGRRGNGHWNAVGMLEDVDHRSTVTFGGLPGRG